MTGVDAQHTNAVPDSPLRPPLRLRWSLDSHADPVAGARRRRPGADARADPRPGHVRRRARRRRRPPAVVARLHVPRRRRAGLRHRGRPRLRPQCTQPTPDVIRVEALDAASGALQWSKDIPAPQGLASYPTVDGGAALPAGRHLRVDRVLRCASPTGRRSGSAPTSRAASARRRSTAAVCTSRSGCGQSYALDRATGAVQWHHDPACSGGGGTDPVLWGGRLYGDSALVLDPASGSKIGDWKGGAMSLAGDVGVERTQDGVRSFGPSYEIHPLDDAAPRPLHRRRPRLRRRARRWWPHLLAAAVGRHPGLVLRPHRAPSRAARAAGRRPSPRATAS